MFGNTSLTLEGLQRLQLRGACVYSLCCKWVYQSRFFCEECHLLIIEKSRFHLSNTAVDGYRTHLPFVRNAASIYSASARRRRINLVCPLAFCTLRFICDKLSKLFLFLSHHTGESQLAVSVSRLSCDDLTSCSPPACIVSSDVRQGLGGR